MSRTTLIMTISLPPQLYKDALKIAKEESRTKSELMREALRTYIERRKFEAIRTKVGRRFKAMGIRTEEDIERLIDEGRK